MAVSIASKSVSFAGISDDLNEVVPGLFIGSAGSARCLDEYKSITGITHVLSIGNFLALYPSHFEYKIYNIEDEESVDIMHIFPETNQFIEDVLSGSVQGSKGKVLVHCMAGISRSASVVIAYLMKSEKLSAVDAFQKLKAARKIISPNAGFRAQLYLYEQMKYQLDETYPPYKRYLVIIKASGMQSLSPKQWKAIAAGDFEDSTFELDPEETLASSSSPSAMADQMLCCKNCKRALATQGSMIKHTRGTSLDLIFVGTEDQRADPCKPRFYHFIPPLRWMIGQENQAEGELECPRCRTKIGTYRWLGKRCSCGRLIVPGFALLKHMVTEGGWEAVEEVAEEEVNGVTELDTRGV